MALLLSLAAQYLIYSTFHDVFAEVTLRETGKKKARAVVYSRQNNQNFVMTKARPMFPDSIGSVKNIDGLAIDHTFPNHVATLTPLVEKRTISTLRDTGLPSEFCPGQ
jgi:hypothetical protein